MEELSHQFLYKRLIESGKRWIEIFNLKKKKPNELAYGRVHYKNDNKKKILQPRSKGLSCKYQWWSTKFPKGDQLTSKLITSGSLVSIVTPLTRHITLIVGRIQYFYYFKKQKQKQNGVAPRSWRVLAIIIVSILNLISSKLIKFVCDCDIKREERRERWRP